ncbi:MAG: DUF3124 domain-containing protein [Xenococcaceae cyanobacterium]
MRPTICLVIAILLLTGCQSFNDQNTAQKTPSQPTESCLQYSPNLNEGVTSVPRETLNPSNIFRGQKIFVPFYSQIYQPEGFSRLDLSGTLSIHNTSETDKIRVTKVGYFNTSGKLVKKCLEGSHSILSPMATTQFGITRQDDSGGPGANFIVEWVAEKSVSDPVVETVMVATSGTQGYTFITSGRVIEELK